MEKKKILIIGGLGKTARPIIDLLIEDYSLVIFDIIPYNANNILPTEDIKIIHGDICDINSLQKAMVDIDTIIHLAVNIMNTENDELSFSVNVFGTFNVLKAAKQMNVKRIIMASSAAVHVDELKNSVSSLTAAICSHEDFTYDLTKNLQELEALNFSNTYAMNIMILRLGHIVNGKMKTDLDENVPLSELAYCKGGWVCQYDVARAFRKAVENGFCGYHLLHIIGSYQAKSRFDILTAKNILDFECLEQFIEY